MAVSVGTKFIIKLQETSIWCWNSTEQNSIFTFILFTIHKPTCSAAERYAASRRNLLNSSSKSGWPLKREEIWNCKTKTFKNTENYINKKTFKKKSRKTIRTISYIYLVVGLYYVLVLIPVLIPNVKEWFINMFIILKAYL